MKLVIFGVPMAKQSARFAKRGNFMRSYQPKKLTDWVAQAKKQIREQLPQDFVPFKGPVVISELVFLFAPPKSWPKKKLAVIERGELIYKDTKPDLDNLNKNINDCCNGIVWSDDAKVVIISNLIKAYSTTPRIEMEVEELEG